MKFLTSSFLMMIIALGATHCSVQGSSDVLDLPTAEIIKRSPFMGRYKVVKDLASPSQFTPPSAISLSWKHNSGAPSLVRTDANNQSSESVLGAWEQSSGSTSDVARVWESTGSRFYWKRNFSQASSRYSYMEVTTSVNFQRTGLGIEYTFNKTTTLTNYDENNRPTVQKTVESEYLLLEEHL